MPKKKNAEKKSKLESLSEKLALLTEKLDASSSKLNESLQKREKINEDIKKYQAEVSDLTGQIERLKFAQLSNAASIHGVSTDEIIQAFLSGDLFALQDKIEGNAATASTGSVSVASDDAAEDDSDDEENEEEEDDDENPASGYAD